MVFANWENLDSQLVCKERMDLHRVSTCHQHLRGKDLIHYSKVILDQFIPLPLVHLGIFSCHHLQIQQVKHHLNFAYFAPLISLFIYHLELTFRLPLFIFYSSTVEYQAERQSCLLQRTQLPSLGCSSMWTNPFSVSSLWKHLRCSFFMRCLDCLGHVKTFDWLVNCSVAFI